MARVKYLVFRLDQHLFGVPLTSIKEVIELRDLTPLLNAPDWHLGLMNLRGKVITILDLKRRLSSRQLHREAGESGGRKARRGVIVIEPGGNTLGCAVDQITEVLVLEEGAIERGAEVPSDYPKGFVKAVARVEGRPMILLVDLETVDAERQAREAVA